MQIKTLAGALAALAMTASPIAASAATPASALSLTRAATPTARTSKIAEGSSATLINVGIFAALIVIVLVATTTGDDDEDAPDSP
jgi:hypothetical protein